MTYITTKDSSHLGDRARFGVGTFPSSRFNQGVLLAALCDHRHLLSGDFELENRREREFRARQRAHG